MSVQAGTNIKKNYLPVFEEYPEVMGFFSLKDGAVEGSPYNNPEMFRQLGLEDAVRVWPTQVHETRVAVIRQEDVDAAKDNPDSGRKDGRRIWVCPGGSADLHRTGNQPMLL